MMDVLYAKDHPEMGCVYEIGTATWHKHLPPEERSLSVRARFTNSNGGFSTGSPEVPIEALAPMLAFAVETGALQVGVTSDWWSREHSVPGVSTES